VRIFTKITLPLSLPGVFAGCLMCLTLSLGMYITPALLGGRQDMMLANLIDFYTRQTLDWTLASAIAIVLLVFSGLLILMMLRAQNNQEAVRGNERSSTRGLKDVVVAGQDHSGLDRLSVPAIAPPGHHSDFVRGGEGA